MGFLALYLPTYPTLVLVVLCARGVGVRQRLSVPPRKKSNGSLHYTGPVALFTARLSCLVLQKQPGTCSWLVSR